MNQKGFANLLLVLLLLAGLAFGVYLVGQQTNLFSRASSNPVQPGSGLQASITGPNKLYNGTEEYTYTAVVTDTTGQIGAVEIWQENKSDSRQTGLIKNCRATTQEQKSKMTCVLKGTGALANFPSTHYVYAAVSRVNYQTGCRKTECGPENLLTVEVLTGPTTTPISIAPSPTITPVGTSCTPSVLTGLTFTQPCNGGYKRISFSCQDGFYGREGDNSSCKSVVDWDKIARDSCKSKQFCPTPTKKP